MMSSHLKKYLEDENKIQTRVRYIILGIVSINFKWFQFYCFQHLKNSSLPETGIKIFSAFLHTHLSGKWKSDHFFQLNKILKNRFCHMDTRYRTRVTIVARNI